MSAEYAETMVCLRHLPAEIFEKMWFHEIFEKKKKKKFDLVLLAEANGVFFKYLNQL